jgi:hypothetical protein
MSASLRRAEGRVSIAAVFAAISCLAGCGGGPTAGIPDLARVTGTVKMDGQPLAGVVVNFNSESSRPSSGTTDDQGKYKLMFNEKTEGAAIGKHKVMIIKIPNGQTSPGQASQMAIPMQYSFQSTLTADVKTGDNVLDFDLKSQ